MKIKNKKTWISVIFLISIEQIIKIIINSNYLDKNIPILPPLLYFKPIFNRDYSWFNSMLQLGIGRWIHILIAAVMSLLIYLFYSYLNNRIGINRVINIMFAFVFSGALCSLIDKVFWNGSLDYIQLKGFFTFDLKDLYINVFIGMLILLALMKNKTLEEIDDRNIIKDFAKYILRKP
ncbi:lipoprotein signal peptidase [Gottschalkia purinilytica]|uniref:Lipoprotein signal peptidase n=1 Tax=Gottschalkia purinilytica TaxID=1503 RepID=A0A0L0WCC6_GOTPU|nr:signal peptidase II [Gottschalkia purinilytica]KNF09060.1 lipoprotein signal peptidase [Gottschalkia purinilytica]